MMADHRVTTVDSGEPTSGRAVCSTVPSAGNSTRNEMFSRTSNDDSRGTLRIPAESMVVGSDRPDWAYDVHPL